MPSRGFAGLGLVEGSSRAPPRIDPGLYREFVEPLHANGSDEFFAGPPGKYHWSLGDYRFISLITMIIIYLVDEFLCTWSLKTLVRNVDLFSFIYNNNSNNNL